MQTSISVFAFYYRQSYLQRKVGGTLTIELKKTFNNAVWPIHPFPVTVINGSEKNTVHFCLSTHSSEKLVFALSGTLRLCWCRFSAVNFITPNSDTVSSGCQDKETGQVTSGIAHKSSGVKTLSYYWRRASALARSVIPKLRWPIVIMTTFFR